MMTSGDESQLEPKTLDEAISGQNRDSWSAAIKEELDAHNKN